MCMCARARACVYVCVGGCLLLWHQCLFALQVLGHLKAGRRLRHPEGCPDAVYQAMQRCWSDTPELRPAFSSAEGLVALLSKL